MPARGDGARQVSMADECGSIAYEGGVAKDVIRMAVRIDNVPDRFVGTGTDRRKQLLSLAHAAAAVDHGNGVFADNESDIGNRTVVLACHERGLAAVHDQAGSDLAYGQPLL